MSRKNTPRDEPAPPLKTEFSFELLKPYPEARTFVIKKPLKGSLSETVFELLGSKR